jgi:hypothetical protein
LRSFITPTNRLFCFTSDGTGDNRAGEALGATRLQVLWNVGLPRAMPYVFASLKVAILGYRTLRNLRRQPQCLIKLLRLGI